MLKQNRQRPLNHRPKKNYRLRSGSANCVGEMWDKCVGRGEEELQRKKGLCYNTDIAVASDRQRSDAEDDFLRLF